MLKASHFEKFASPVTNEVVRLLKTVIKRNDSEIIKNRLSSESMSEIEKDREEFKLASIDNKPKRRAPSVNTVRKNDVPYDVGRSVVSAIKRSKNPKDLIKKNKNSTEPMYAGGNTESDMRNAIRSIHKK